MATASGNKVGISKRRQTDNEEGELKRYDDGDKESRQAHKILRKAVRRKEMKTIKKLIPERTALQRVFLANFLR